MPRRQKPFAETGAANSFVDLWENGAGFRHSDDQRKMTPFQRQVIEAARAKEAEMKEEQMNQSQQGGQQSRPRNDSPNAGLGNNSSAGSTHEQSETVRYINQDEYPDHEVHDS